MEHVFFSDGNQKRISWAIKNNNTTSEQCRDHPDMYLDKVSIEQAKYIALHAGIFWCVGRFIIKDGDTVRVMLDLKTMYDHLSNNELVTDPFILSRTDFIKQLIDQRQLLIKYELIGSADNVASKMLIS